MLIQDIMPISMALYLLRIYLQPIYAGTVFDPRPGMYSNGSEKILIR